MRALLRILFCFLLLRTSSFAERVDRIEAVVNQSVITWRELQIEARLQGLIEGEISHWNAPLSQDYLNDVRERLIDQALFLQEASRFQVSVDSPSSLEEGIKRIKQHFRSEEDWHHFLRAYDIRPQEMRRRVERRLVIQILLESRVKPLVRLSSEEVEEFIRQEVGEREMTEREKRGLEHRLFQERYEERIEEWLKRLRNRGQIERLD